MISSKSFEDSTLPNNMYWYKFNYSLDKVTEERLQQLRAPVVPDNGKRLDLPPANNFIATNFDVLPEDASLSARPMLVKQWEDLADLWYKKDDKFKKPKGTVACKIYTDDLMFGQSPQTVVFAELWKRSLTEVLREFSYLAEQAKLDFSFTLYIDNIDLRWSGFNDKLVNFVTETLQKINEFRNMEALDIFN